MMTAGRVRLLLVVAAAATMCALTAVVVVSLLRPGRTNEPARPRAQTAGLQVPSADAAAGKHAPPSGRPSAAQSAPAQSAAPGPEAQAGTAQQAPQPPPAQPTKSRPKIEDLGQLMVTAKTEYGPQGDPNVVVERLDFGGIRVMVKSPGVSSMQASYGLWLAQRAVRQAALDASQLAHVEQFEKEFRPTVDARLAERLSNVERTAAEIADALAQQQWSDYRRQMGELERQMKDVSDEWQRLYDEYLRGISPLLPPDQYEAVESSLGRKKAAP